MSREELCRFLGLSESTIRTNFTRTAEKFYDRGIIIYKEGRGKNTEYYIEELYEGRLKQYLQKHFHRIVAD